VKAKAKRPEGIRKSGSAFEIVVGPQLLVGVMGILGVLALVLVGFAIGRRGSSPPATVAAAPQASSQMIQVPAGSVDSSITNMQVAPQPATDTKKPVSEKDVPIGDAPRLALPELVNSAYTYSFGKVTTPDKITKQFQIKNIGNKPLEIANVASSCGCTAALVREKTVPPGGESAFMVEFDPAVYADHNTLVNAWVTIASNDPLAPVVKVDFSSEVLIKK
jgi:hypothetical protein